LHEPKAESRQSRGQNWDRERVLGTKGGYTPNVVKKHPGWNLLFRERKRIGGRKGFSRSSRIEIGPVVGTESQPLGGVFSLGGQH
jgi:hypothetical protein